MEQRLKSYRLDKSNQQNREEESTIFTKKSVITILALGVLSVVAVGCAAGSPAETPAPPTPTEAPAPQATPTPEPVAEEAPFDVGPCSMTLAAQLPIEFEYAGTIPTGFDGINQTNCTFTKDVETVTVVLTGPATHTEVFTLDKPTTQVSFPLPEGTLSISTLEIVPPGEYQREITVTSVTGETLIISDQPGVLKTVTILEPQS